MNTNDGTQKEKVIIPSLEGVEDVFMGRSSDFWLLGPENLILTAQGPNLVA